MTAPLTEHKTAKIIGEYYTATHEAVTKTELAELREKAAAFDVLCDAMKTLQRMRLGRFAGNVVSAAIARSAEAALRAKP